MSTAIEHTVGVMMWDAEGECWGDFDSAADLETAVERTLQLWSEDDDPARFLFLDVMGEPVAGMVRDVTDPEIAVLSYPDGRNTRRFRCRYVERDGRNRTLVVVVDRSGRAIGSPRIL